MAQKTATLQSPSTKTDIEYHGGGSFLTVQGEFNGGTIEVSYSVDGGTTYVPYTLSGSQLTFSSNGGSQVYIPSGKIKFSTDVETSVDVDIYFY